MAARRSTGIDALNRELGGMLAPGRIVCSRTEAGSQGERLLRAFALRFEAFYLSTTRTDDAVAEWLSADAHDVEVRYAGVDGLRPRGGAAVRQWVQEASGWSARDGAKTADTAAQLDGLSVAIRAWDGSVIIDPVNPVETAPEPAYLSFLQELQGHLRTTDSLGILHLVDADPDPAGRWLSLRLADEVWDVSVAVANARVEFRLTITKSRSNDLPGEQIKLDLGESVMVDTSRDIS